MDSGSDIALLPYARERALQLRFSCASLRQPSEQVTEAEGG